MVYDITAGLRSEFTKQSYKWGFSYFLKYLKLDNPVLLLGRDPKEIENTLIQFEIWMAEEKKLSYNSITTIMNAICYHTNDSCKGRLQH